ncbi:MAG TPA: DNA-binding protein [Rariglobus sp.]|jgi:N-glycosylase/DNA lyase|nr:DNA-binding protein [Rariglobus sp.]
MSSDPCWSDWRPLLGAPLLTQGTFAELIDGGQSFRWQQDTAGSWLGIWGDCVVRLKLDSAGNLHWSAPAPITSHVDGMLPAYLFGHDTRTAIDSLPWRSDTHLARCLAAFPGLTILRQPFGETLLGFLCSATKQIVQIKQMVSLLAERHGATLIGAYRRLPTWGELALIPEAELRACLLGFRARYIHQTALFLAAHPGWLEETEHLPYLEAKARLCELPGVGEKVADCVLLFGAGKLEAFPVDTWIIKAMARRYRLDGWTPAQVSHFGRTHFGAHAGLAQQYLFAYERAAAQRERSINSTS